MGHCVECDRRGIFVTVDSYGLCKKCRSKNTNKIQNGLLTVSNTLLSTERVLLFHADLQGMIWVADGKEKNYSPQKEAEDRFGNIRVFMSTSLEPSIISIALPIEKPESIMDVPKLPYFPVYAYIEPLQRWRYLEYLQNPYQDIDIGYVFLLYYGLERHLLFGDFEKAFDVILKLRHKFDNKSFQAYSSSALILSCVKYEKVEHIQKFIKTLDEAKIQCIDISLFLLCLHTFNLPLSAKHIMLFAKQFAFENNRYIKSTPDIFLEELEIALQEKTGIRDVNINKININIWKVKQYSFRAFANTSISDININIPDLMTEIKLTSLCNGALTTAHENTKIRLRKERSNKTP